MKKVVALTKCRCVWNPNSLNIAIVLPMDALGYSKIAKILVYGKPNASLAGDKVGGKGGGERDFR